MAVLLSGVSKMVVKIWICFTLHTLCFDEVAHFVGFEEQDKGAASKIREGPLQCQTYCQTRGSDNGDETGGLHTHHLDGGNEEQDLQRDRNQTVQEPLQRWLNTASVQYLSEQTAQHAYEHAAHPKDNKCHQHLGRVSTRRLIALVGLGGLDLGHKVVEKSPWWYSRIRERVLRC